MVVSRKTVRHCACVHATIGRVFMRTRHHFRHWRRVLLRPRGIIRARGLPCRWRSASTSTAIPGQSGALLVTLSRSPANGLRTAASDPYPTYARFYLLLQIYFKNQQSPAGSSHPVHLPLPDVLSIVIDSFTSATERHIEVGHLLFFRMCFRPDVTSSACDRSVTASRCS